MDKKLQKKLEKLFGTLGEAVALLLQIEEQLNDAADKEDK